MIVQMNDRTPLSLSCLLFGDSKPCEWLASDFSLRYDAWIKYKDHEKIWNGHQFQRFVIAN